MDWMPPRRRKTAPWAVKVARIYPRARLPVLYAETADQDFACLCRVCASSFPSLDEAFRHLDAALSGGSD